MAAQTPKDVFAGSANGMSLPFAVVKQQRYTDIGCLFVDNTAICRRKMATPQRYRMLLVGIQKI
jgi:hypothetical protein